MILVRFSFDRVEDKAPKSKAGVREVPMPKSVAGELKRHRRVSVYTTDDALFSDIFLTWRSHPVPLVCLASVRLTPSPKEIDSGYQQC